MGGKPFVSIIIPVRNEERYIERCLYSVLNQDYAKEHLEIIFVDGKSNDKTKEIITQYTKEYNHIILLENPNKTVPYAMNRGIKQAKGKYIIRMDAHSEYEQDYISQCVYYLGTTDADNVGGVALCKSSGYIGNTIGLALSSVFGVGNSIFRTTGKEGYVDTVPFGAFRREVFEQYGLFDERLTRNEDNEMNSRIRKAGGKIYLTPKIRFYYYHRDRIPDLAKQGYSNGMWNIIAHFLHPGSMAIRHFVPFTFVISITLFLLVGMIGKNNFFINFFLLEMGSYFALNIFFSIRSCIKKGFKYIPMLIIVFFIFHFSYGIGSCMGLLKTILGKVRQ
ncbi:MAG: glycosyltransferase family 2 protein [Epulopiscium sp.]|nr:glycosyltransferase family 2 protein [Candidatus Epulonipiscium sp.]